MAKLLHIIATPKAKESRTLKVSETFLTALKDKEPDLEIDTLNLFNEELPNLSPLAIKGKMELLAGSELSQEYEESWSGIKQHIENFLSADKYLLSTPMWNFSIPYQLKHYLDVIVQPKFTFQYTNQGPEGLVKDKKMVVITSRGGDYGPGSHLQQYDHQQPYLKTILGFIGITDLRFINAEPMDAGGEDLRNERLEIAKNQALLFAEEF